MDKETEQSVTIVQALLGMDGRIDDMMRLWQRMCVADGGTVYPVDLMAFGAINRSLSQIAGLRSRVKARNLICSRALLRMQIDTAVRFSAIWLVEKPHRFAQDVLHGKRIDKLTDSSGKRLTDAHLLQCLSTDHPWLPSVYERTSGYIHFSGDHLLMPLENVEAERNTAALVISEVDRKHPESSWLEVIDCFNKATDIFLNYLLGWVESKERAQSKICS